MKKRSQLKGKTKQLVETKKYLRCTNFEKNNNNKGYRVLMQMLFHKTYWYNRIYLKKKKTFVQLCRPCKLNM